MSRIFAFLMCLSLAVVWSVAAADKNTNGAPEPNPPLIVREEVAPAASPVRKLGLSSGPTLYSIGQPTDDEQLYLELINRARANPPAEGAWLAALTEPGVLSAINQFGVDVEQMVSEFQAISPAQPLAFNQNLIAAARGHSQLMFQQEEQAHVLSGEQDIGTRIAAAGYDFSSVGENIFASSDNTIYGHAGFQIDWGSTNINFPNAVTFGMQNPRGHRNSIHNPAFREVGVGIFMGDAYNEATETQIGPQLVTQDFGVQQSAVPLLTGVVYHDLNSNEFYDLGEGLGGVQVEVTGADFFAVTSGSGGYTIPLPGNGSYTVSFTAANGGTFTTNITVTGGLNFKVDWVPVYQPPTLTGPANPVNGFNMSYGFTTPIGITDYSWQVVALTPLSFADNADSGLDNFTANTSAGYSVTGADNVVARSSVFHLAHPQPESQKLQLKTVFIPKLGAALSFVYRFSNGTELQVPRVQYSQDNGQTWSDLWALPGGVGNDSSPYQTVNLDLGGLSRVETIIRFNYDFLPQAGSYFNGTSYNVGWMIDNIQLSGVDTGATAGSDLVSNAAQFPFTATTTGTTFLVFLKPSVVNRNYPGSNVLEVRSVGTPTVTISSLAASPGKKFDVSFSHAASGGLKILTATSITGPWTEETGVAIQTTTPEQNFQVTLPGFSGSRFFQATLVAQ